MRILLFFMFFLLYSCNKPKTVLICGDHVCVNKAEAEYFFEENLSLEVQIINKKEPEDKNLVELNLEKISGEDKKVSIFRKKETNNIIKELSKNEIKKRKAEIKKNKKTKLFKKTNNEIIEKSKIKNQKSNISKKKQNIHLNNEIRDICTIIKECNIDEISKYLVKQGNKKKFPDITTRENK